MLDLLNHLGFQAWVETNSRVAPVFRKEVDHDLNHVSCWIPGIPGQPFIVYWHDSGSGVATCAYIILNGRVLAPGRFLRGMGIANRGGIRISEDKEQPFMFRMSSDEGIQVPPASVEYTQDGTIVLKIQRAIINGYRPSDRVQGLSIGLGPEIGAVEQLPWTYKVYSYEDPTSTKLRTYITFTFRYRSPNFLIANGIATEADMATFLAPPNGGDKKGKGKNKRAASDSIEQGAVRP